MASMAPAPQHDPRSDGELIDAINSGSDQAFEALYLRYRDWVVGLAMRFTRDRDSALDVLQETFLYLARKRPNLTLTAKMTTFLYPVVKHLAIARNKKRRREPNLDPALAPPVADHTEPRATSVRDELRVVVDALPEHQREVVLLRFVDDMDLAEIARALRIPVGTVKSRLHHALRALRDDERTRIYFGM